MVRRRFAKPVSSRISGFDSQSRRHIFKMKKLAKDIFWFLWAVLIYWVVFPYADKPSLTANLCYQFVCQYPLTEIPKATCDYCNILNFLAFMLTNIWLISVAWNLTKDILEEIKGNKKTEKDKDSNAE